MKRRGSATWKGGLKEGRGLLAGLNPRRSRPRVNCPISALLNAPITLTAALE